MHEHTQSESNNDIYCENPSELDLNETKVNWMSLKCLTVILKSYKALDLLFVKEFNNISISDIGLLLQCSANIDDIFLLFFLHLCHFSQIELQKELQMEQAV